LFDEEEVIRQRVNYLKDRHWIDKQTKEVTFSILILNGQYEPLVCESLLTFDFSRGKKRAKQQTFAPANDFYLLLFSLS
jgi:hypothetical protein